jgi:dihydrofolate reductase
MQAKEKQNFVFIAQSLDGYIADKNGGLEWLESVPNPDALDMGYNKFIKGVDAIVMGRVTFETVSNFDCDWPYTVPVFVLSNNLKSLDEKLKNKVEIVNGSLSIVLETINKKGYHSLYIDGGQVIQSFLKEDLIDEMILTTIPILLGRGHSLFGDLDKAMAFDLVKSEVFLDAIVQSSYKRKK